LIGFEVGWLMWLARVFAFAALCNLFVSYLSYLVPAVSGPSWRIVVIAVVVSSLTIANLSGVRITTRVSNFFTVGKLIPLLLFVAAGVFFIRPERYSFETSPSYSAFSQAALLLVFAYTAFEVAIISAGETRDPQRDVPFALLTGIGLVVALYLSIQLVSIGTLPELATSERPLADASRLFLGPAGALIVSIGALLSLVGTMHATIFAIPRLLFAMAEQGQVPRVFMATHPRFRTPHVAILASAVVMLGLTFFSTFISALTISTIIRLLVYIVTCAALPVLRKTSGVPPPAFVVRGGPVIAAVAIVLSVWLLTSSTWYEARLVAVAAFAGLLVYLPCARSRPLLD
jgi:amino acid transporter